MRNARCATASLTYSQRDIALQMFRYRLRETRRAATPAGPTRKRLHRNGNAALRGYAWPDKTARRARGAAASACRRSPARRRNGLAHAHALRRTPVRRPDRASPDRSRRRGTRHCARRGATAAAAENRARALRTSRRCFFSTLPRQIRFRVRVSSEAYVVRALCVVRVSCAARPQCLAKASYGARTLCVARVLCAAKMPHLTRTQCLAKAPCATPACATPACATSARPATPHPDYAQPQAHPRPCRQAAGGTMSALLRQSASSVS